MKLVRHSSAFEEADRRGWLPLHEAAAQINKNILQVTLKGLESFRVSTKKVTDLGVMNHPASNMFCFFCILASPAITWEQTTLKGETPLLVAVRNCFVDNVSFLLLNGCNPNAKNEEGDSALVTGEYLVSWWRAEGRR